jgi:hypothetical protein
VYPDELLVEWYRLIDGKYAEPDILGPQEILTLSFASLASRSRNPKHLTGC